MILSKQKIKRIRANAVDETAERFNECTANYINAVLRGVEKPKNKEEIKEFFNRTFNDAIRTAEYKSKSLTA